ncbi:MAG: extracellular solute-binding protein [Chloroflexota bacterium]
MFEQQTGGTTRPISRRDLLRWGLYAGTMLSLADVLAACGGSTASPAASAPASSGGAPAKNPAASPSTAGNAGGAAVKIVYATLQDDSGTVRKQIDAWNQATPKVQVQYQQMPKVSGDFHTQLVASFTAKSAVPDVTDCDVIWPGEFASAGWLKPLDSYLTDSFKKSLFPSAVSVGQYQGKNYAIQRYYDAGQLYYRTDILKKHNVSVPTTMADLVSAAQKLQEAERPSNPNFWGFYWIGAQIEALFDEFLEWYWGLGGKLTDPKGKINFNNDAGLKAVQYMYDTIYTSKISPPGTPTYKTPDIVHFMQNGNTPFMRNWNFAWALLQDPKQSKVQGNIGNAPLPGKSGRGYGCTGGWSDGAWVSTPTPSTRTRPGSS